MSSPFAAIRPAPVSATPGMALVRRLEGSALPRQANWTRILPRLCLFVLPALRLLLLQCMVRLNGASRVGFSAHLHFLQIFLFAWIGAVEFFHVGSCAETNREHTGAMGVLYSLCAALGVSLLLMHLLELQPPGLAPCVVDAAVFLFASVSIRLAFRAISRAQRPLTRLLVAVAHIAAGEISWELMRKEVSAHSISGAILLDDIEPSGHLAGQLSTDEFLRTIRHEQADAVLVSAPALEIPSLSQRISESGLRMPVGFLVSPAEDISDRVSGAGGVYLLNTGAQPAATLNYRLFKRAFDILFSFTALVAGLPLLLLIALLVKIGSRGPIFFVQDRVGWNGRVFRMYKFRTMRSASAIESDTRWTSPGNARVTPVGRFLRRYSLDELPQFLNVFLGDMSLVGPRPERPFFVSTFRRQIDEYHRRHQLKVGLTGWAQVNGLRGDTCIRTRLMYDLYYLQNWGLIFDLKIVLRTVLCVFTGRNAH